MIATSQEPQGAATPEVRRVLGQAAPRAGLGLMHPSIDPTTYAADFARQGYLLLPALIPPRVVREARADLVQGMRAATPAVDLEAPAPGQPPFSLMDRQDLAQRIHPLLEHPSIREAVVAMAALPSPPPAGTGKAEGVLRQDRPPSADAGTGAGQSLVVPHPYKWLRAVGPGLFTGPHVDRTYVGQLAPHLITCWLPIGPCTRDQGSLILAPGSHVSPDLAALRAPVPLGRDGTASGWIPTDHPDLARVPHWVTHDFQAGDVCFLHLDTIHGTGANATDHFRLSCDTRWAVFHG
jgi:hypothetical protein